MTFAISLHPVSGRVLFSGTVNGLSFEDQDFGSPEDCIANWPAYAADIAVKHVAWLEGQTTVVHPDFGAASSDGGPSAAQIDVERDRRIAAGFTFAGVRYQARPQDRAAITAAAQVAASAMAVEGRGAGDLLWHGGAEAFAWIAADNSRVPMDAPTVIALGKAATAHHGAHVLAGRAVKDRFFGGERPPVAYTDDSLWPPAA